MSLHEVHTNPEKQQLGNCGDDYINRTHGVGDAQHGPEAVERDDTQYYPDSDSQS